MQKDPLLPEAHRARSRIDVFIHFVWTTYRRESWLVPELETPIYRCLAQQVAHCGCRVWGIGGLADHVHLLVCMSAVTTCSQLMKQAKATSSAMARDLTNGNCLGWQDNYAAFSVSCSDLDAVSNYIRFQKERHAAGKLWRSVENLDFAVPDDWEPALPEPPEIWWPE